jgi:hypothetical protein
MAASFFMYIQKNATQGGEALDVFLIRLNEYL